MDSNDFLQLLFYKTFFAKENTPFSSSGKCMCAKRGWEPRLANAAKSCYVCICIYYLSAQTQVHMVLAIRWKKQKIKHVDIIKKKKIHHSLLILGLLILRLKVVMFVYMTRLWSAPSYTVPFTLFFFTIVDYLNHSSLFKIGSIYNIN